MSSPRNIRFSDTALKALKSLEAATGRKPGDLVSESVVEKHNKTVALAPIALRLLDPAEILTLQAEIAALEKIHNDNRRRIKIKTSDKNATGKIIQVVEKIDLETADLKALRLKIGIQAQLAESLTPDDLKNIRILINWTRKRIEQAKAQSTDNTAQQLPIYETELKILNALFS